MQHKVHFKLMYCEQNLQFFLCYLPKFCYYCCDCVSWSIKRAKWLCYRSHQVM